MSDVDDGSIKDDAGLLRRIHPKQIVADQNKGGQRRPSSAAFLDPELSVDVEPLLHAESLDWQFSLKGFSGHSLVRFRAGAARAMQLAVIHKPEPANKAHAEVVGKKTRAIANHLRDASDWVYLHST
jgi:hypothetical protein